MYQTLTVLFVGCLIAGCTTTPIRKSTEPLTSVAQVDLSRYVGLWYEIASRPNRFQKDCVATTANYTLESDGTIAILNECREKTLDGKRRSAKGIATPVDATNAKLKVTFFWPFKGDYWVIELGQNYEYSVVGEPSGKYLWILSRTPHMDEARLQEILQRLAQKGYDISQISKTLQP